MVWVTKKIYKMSLSMDFYIKPYISASVYNTGSECSRSYVVNEITHNEFLFEGLSSDFLANILKTASLCGGGEFYPSRA